ncbi:MULTISPECIES: DUF732 domain-containing protein [Corynebacterium]|uniref:DUF732 domain-containing protein n=2 Tax=Corynebacteriaceae TaxID=1653 RepID=UPI001EF3D8FC|nr:MULTISPECIES: DUF732 domain-containing protein [Corynebacterium]MCG7243211.1 DUF732 domain-containing protein [Corynebacterium sp. ACRPS]MCG7271239.1 DUF732 domain-containing protein [Corynebacterium sp. ACRQM]MCG7233647.1 DUF732 domain-containing protein [Corynebacterium sp. ACRPR]MDK8474464.1 DUF732 domain-containing protein [Corynebacterium sp. MSK078]MDK8659824.1 DUF732 domain-containing protein [Corynebacterium sp. MSK204]
MRKLALVGAVLCLGLAGCDSATVDSDSGNDTSVAPLSREKTSEESTTSSSESASSSASSSQEPSESKESAEPTNGSRSANSPEDRGAREISEIPSAQLPKEEAAYLDSLKDAGVNVDGVEDQLLGAGQGACGDNGITIPAVAGQLIEQQRSDMDYEELTKLLQDNARSALC